MYAAGGYSNTLGVIVCVDNEGNLVWNKITNGIGYSLFVNETNNDVYHTNANNNSYMRINNTGNTVWIKSAGQSDRAYGMLYSNTNNFAYLYISSPTGGRVHKLDNDTGNIISSSNIFGTFNQCTMTIIDSNLYVFNNGGSRLSILDSNTLNVIDVNSTYLPHGYIDDKLKIFVNFTYNQSNFNVYDLNDLSLIDTRNTPYPITVLHYNSQGRYALTHSAGVTYIDENDTVIWNNTTSNGRSAIVSQVI